MSFLAQNLILRIIVVLAMLLAAIFAVLLYGHAMMRNPNRVRFIADVAAISLVKWLKGEEAARERERELVKPDRVQRIGKQYARAGLLLLVVVFLCLVVDMIRLYVLLGTNPGP